MRGTGEATFPGDRSPFFFFFFLFSSSVFGVSDILKTVPSGSMSPVQHATYSLPSGLKMVLLNLQVCLKPDKPNFKTAISRPKNVVRFYFLFCPFYHSKPELSLLFPFFLYRGYYRIS